VTTDEQPPRPRPTAGVFMIIGVIIVWAIFIASLSDFVGRWPALLQLPFYIVAGVVWILPLKPILRWSETGRWRADPPQP
jgi:predicted membrane channel-forming protein YqfA (hemolysin III family)